jgi:hypothetical protein
MTSYLCKDKRRLINRLVNETEFLSNQRIALHQIEMEHTRRVHKLSCTILKIENDIAKTRQRLKELEKRK